MDGTRLLSQHRYEAAKTSTNLSDEDMRQRSGVRVHVCSCNVCLMHTMEFQSGQD